MRRNGTRGCRATPPRMGSPELLRVLHSNGLATPYRVSVPAGYQPHTAWPLLLALHGWGMPYESESGWHQHGRAHGYVVVTPQGFSDGGLGPSWNGAGSVGSPGAGGATCTRPHAAAGFCYPSCGKCGDGCWWTTCLDSVGQVAALLDEVMGDWCIARGAVYATGLSNGGGFLFELARDKRTAGRIAAYFPTNGLPHAGFNSPPAHRPASLLGLWGARDTFMPPLANTAVAGHPGDPAVSLDTAFGANGTGWFFSVARSVTSLWARANGCAEAAPSPLDLSASLSGGVPASARLRCVGWRHCSGGARVVECIHGGEHEPPPWRANLFWSFARGEWPARRRRVPGHGGRPSLPVAPVVHEPSRPRAGRVAGHGPKLKTAPRGDR